MALGSFSSQDARMLPVSRSKRLVCAAQLSPAVVSAALRADTTPHEIRCVEEFEGLHGVKPISLILISQGTVAAPDSSFQANSANGKGLRNAAHQFKFYI